MMSLIREMPPGLYRGTLLHGGLETTQFPMNVGNGMKLLLLVSFTTSIG